MGDGARQLAGGREFLDFEHAPFHLQLLEFSPGREIPQDRYRVRNLPARIVNFPRTRRIFHLVLRRGIVQAQGAVILVRK